MGFMAVLLQSPRSRLQGGSRNGDDERVPSHSWCMSRYRVTLRMVSTGSDLHCDVDKIRASEAHWVDAVQIARICDLFSRQLGVHSADGKLVLAGLIQAK